MRFFFRGLKSAGTSSFAGKGVVYSNVQCATPTCDLQSQELQKLGQFVTPISFQDLEHLDNLLAYHAGMRQYFESLNIDISKATFEEILWRPVSGLRSMNLFIQAPSAAPAHYFIL